jgi:hypothetical protein
MVSDWMENIQAYGVGERNKKRRLDPLGRQHFLAKMPDFPIILWSDLENGKRAVSATSCQTSAVTTSDHGQSIQTGILLLAASHEPPCLVDTVIT